MWQADPAGLRYLRTKEAGGRAVVMMRDVANLPNLIPALRDRLTRRLHARDGDRI